MCFGDTGSFRTHRLPENALRKMMTGHTGMGFVYWMVSTFWTSAKINIDQRLVALSVEEVCLLGPVLKMYPLNLQGFVQ